MKPKFILTDPLQVDGKFYTLVALNYDPNDRLYQNIQWVVCNIPGSELKSAENQNIEGDESIVFLNYERSKYFIYFGYDRRRKNFYARMYAKFVFLLFEQDSKMTVNDEIEKPERRYYRSKSKSLNKMLENLSLENPIAGVHFDVVAEYDNGTVTTGTSEVENRVRSFIL